MKKPVTYRSISSVIFAVIIVIEMLIYFLGGNLFLSKMQPATAHEISYSNNYDYNASTSDGDDSTGLKAIPNIGAKVAQSMAPSTIYYPGYDPEPEFKNNIEKVIIITLIVGAIVIFAMPNKPLKTK